MLLAKVSTVDYFFLPETLAMSLMLFLLSVISVLCKCFLFTAITCWNVRILTLTLLSLSSLGNLQSLIFSSHPMSVNGSRSICFVCTETRIYPAYKCFFHPCIELSEAELHCLFRPRAASPTPGFPPPSQWVVLPSRLELGCHSDLPSPSASRH